MRDLTKETDRLFRKKLAKNGDLKDNQRIETSEILWLHITYKGLKLRLIQQDIPQNYKGCTLPIRD